MARPKPSDLPGNSEAGAPAEIDGGTPRAEEEPSPPTLLVVDDEEGILEAVSLTLASEGRVLVARNGREALALLATEDVALILTDQRMPGMTGVELLERARETRPQAIGILLTGYTDIEALADAKEEFACMHLLFTAKVYGAEAGR